MKKSDLTEGQSASELIDLHEGKEVDADAFQARILAAVVN